MTAFDSYSSDDDEDKCPLCIEDMDITDKNFKPCPCGFQLCQFCYNNIRSGPEQYNRCPACRRPYDDESIEYRTLTAEEMKQEQERKQRKEQTRKQREREKNKDLHHHHFDQRDKKHLANVRVIQKNLVYVIGLNPNIPSEDLQQMLRRDEFFGQYGKIQKIVVNKRVNGNGNLGVGVYVTFARKEDAARCIAAVDGSVNDGKYLRAAYGTTKYCSSYLRGQNCPNQNCMFLHEPGEEADSFNRHPTPSHTPAPTGAGPGPLPQLSVLPQSAGAHNVSASASPASVHSTLSSSTGNASYLPSAQASSSGLQTATASPQTPVSSAAVISTSSVPSLPAWGKVTPQIPPVHKLVVHDLPDPATESLKLLETNLNPLSTNSWDFQFISEILSPDAKFPPMFSLPMDEKRRLKSYNKAMAELDKLLSQQQQQQPSDPELEARQGYNGTSEDRSSSVSSTATTESRAETKKNNSQHLLAHLMRGVTPASPQSDRQDEDTKCTELPVKRLDHSAAASLLDKLKQDSDPLHGIVADTLRQVGVDLMQPPAPVDVQVSEDIDVGQTNLVDDGPAFDLNNIPQVPIAGDREPSVWSAIEDLTRQRELLARREKEFAASKAQTKKRMKRIRV